MNLRQPPASFFLAQHLKQPTSLADPASLFPDVGNMVPSPMLLGDLKAPLKPEENLVTGN